MAVSIGVTTPVQIVTAATSDAPVKQKLIKTKKNNSKSHSNDGHGLDQHQLTETEEHSSAKPEATNATEHHGNDGGHDATSHGEDKEHQGISSIPEFLLSPQAQRIEFFSFLGLLGLGILAPELFYRPRKKNQNVIYLETEKKSQESELSTAQKQPNFNRGNVTFAQFSDKPALKDTATHNGMAPLSDSDNQTDQESGQATTGEYPTFTVVTDISQADTIANRQTDSFASDSKHKLDNWSLPKRDTA